MTDSPSGLVRDNLETSLTFLARRDYLNDTLQAELLWITSTNDGDGLVRPKLSYEWQDNVKTWVGADIFYGTRKGLYGQFKDNDRVVIGVELGF